MIPTLSIPTFNVKLPSGKNVKYRPFVTRERSVLLMALQDSSQENVKTALDNLISLCTDNKVKLDDLSVSDAEVLFINIRNKSVGETLDLIHKCEACENMNPIQIDMSKVEVIVPENSNIIKLDDKYDMVMKYPSIGSSLTFPEYPTDEDVSMYLASAIDYIVTDSGQTIVTYMRDESKESIINFIGSMTQDQVSKIESFLSNMPVVKVSHSYNCKCGAKNDIELRGLENFFD